MNKVKNKQEIRILSVIRYSLWSPKKTKIN